MPKVPCSLCFATIERSSESLSTRAKCKHYFHIGCIAVKFNTDCAEDAADAIKSQCPACEITDNNVVNLLKNTSEKLNGLKQCNEKIDKISHDVKSFRSEISSLKITLVDVGVRIDAVTELATDTDRRLFVVESQSEETKVSL